MRRRIPIFILLFLASGLAAAQGFDPLPKLVVHAQYILVTTNTGDDLTNPNMMADDRQAVVDVQNAIKKWGRYALAYNAKDADLILVVRKGRIVESQPGLRVGAGSTTKPSIGANVPTDMGDPREMLALFDASQGLHSTPLWREFAGGGLNPPQMSLVGDLRAAVDKTAKIP
jgi:hypothetical protein